MTLTLGQPSIRSSTPAAKVLDTLPEHVEDMVWDVLDAAAADPWGFRQWDADDPEGEDIRHASVGQPSLTHRVNRPCDACPSSPSPGSDSHHVATP
ncbi:hypothetical protein QQY24_33135 [Streptomyces sp. TG1A-8]|uniref:hypothetical protein n=1 Tax=Streptomyces sp. TG1A-8 TaxID=3051385 RepID=UPI00265BD165|nr:hypothetical protein [Streptomyces sp. TG1A-8]MDO0929937.1 hypothetical protein [Streptomyces sp. TG1A-8]